MRILSMPIVRAVGSQGHLYLSCAVPQEAVQNYLVQMERLLGIERFSEVRKNKIFRDGQDFHITIVDPLELTGISSKLDAVTQWREMSFRLTTLGRSRSGVNDAWFILAESTAAQTLRIDLGLPVKDFHVTLGFDPEDVHDMPKNASSRIK